MLKMLIGVCYVFYSLVFFKFEFGGMMLKDCVVFFSQFGVKDIQLYLIGDVRNKYCFYK